MNNRKYVGLYSTAGTYSQMEADTQFTNSRGYDPGGNNSGFKSDQYTQLVTQAASEADTAKRKQIYSQLNDLLLDESFITSMAWGPARLGARAAVRDIGFTLHEGFYWTNVCIEG